METEIRLENRALFEQRPACWEFILTVDRLERPLEEILREARAIVPTPDFSSPEAPILAGAELMQKNIAVIVAAMEALCPLMESRLAASWGAPGQSGTVPEIEQVCREILSRCKEISAAERAILTAPMHPKLAAAQAKFHGLADENISCILEVVKSIRNFIAAGGTGMLSLDVHLTTDRLAGINIPDLSSSGKIPPAQAAIQCRMCGSPTAENQDSPPKREVCLRSLTFFFGWATLLIGLLSIWSCWPLGLLCLLFSTLCFASAEAAG